MKIKKIVFILAFIIAIILGVNISNAAGSELSATSYDAKVGDKVTIKASFTAAAWNISISGDKISGGNYASQTEDLSEKTTSKSFSLDTSVEGTYTIKMTGDITDANGNVEKVDKKVTDSTQVGVVLDQNKKANKKVSKNTIIKVYVGVLDDTEVVMINVVGMNIDKAKNSLNHKNISYKISYQDVSEGENNVVLKQSISSNTKVKKGQVVSLVVSKLNKSTNDTIDTDKKSDDLNNEDDDSDSNDIENND